MGLDVWLTTGIWQVPTLRVSEEAKFLLERKRRHHKFRESKSEPKPQPRALMGCRKPWTRGSSWQEAFPIILCVPQHCAGAGGGGPQSSMSSEWI